MNMAHFENLLVAVDLSEYSKLVAHQARVLSTLLKIPMTFIYVVNKREEHVAKLKTGREALVQRFSDRIRKVYGLSPLIPIRIEFGEPDEKVIEWAQKFQHPLVLIGHRGGHPIAEFFIGSVAKKLALFSRTPVWIHRGENTIAPKNLVVPYDLEASSLPLVSAVQTLAKDLKASFELFHVMRLPTTVGDPSAYGIIYEAFKKLEDDQVESLLKAFPNLKISRAEGDISFQVQEKSKDFDLIVLSPRYRGQETPFFGTATTHMLSTGTTPILILPGLTRRKPVSLDIF